MLTKIPIGKVVRFLTGPRKDQVGLVVAHVGSGCLVEAPDGMHVAAAFGNLREVGFG